MRYAYYPGCAAEGIALETNTSMRLIAGELGIELVDMPDATCCGAGVIRTKDPLLSLTLNARIFSTAEDLGLDILTICNTCYMVMALAKEELQEKSMREEVNRKLSEMGREYRGEVEIKHLPQVLTADLGLERLGEKVEKPLTELMVAPYYGCHILRPPQVNIFDDPENPRALEDIISTLGATAVDHEEKMKCCGFHGLLAKENEGLSMVDRQIRHMIERGANCAVTPCPLCHTVLDPYQSRMDGEKLPVLHLSQLVGLGLGINPRELGLHRHIISTRGIIEAI